MGLGMYILSTRGGFVETVHPVVAVAYRLGDEGLQRLFVDGEDFASPWRSAGKPFQLHQSLRALAEAGGDPLAYSDEDLALGASSHSGEPHHTAQVADLLGRVGLTDAALLCGAEPPYHGPTHEALLRQGAAPSALHNDCSGKHAFMLAACVSQGWDLDYLPAAHPLQRRIIAEIERVSGVKVGLGTDGCGLPTPVLPVSAMARAWAHLAACVADPARDPLLARIGAAMAAHPSLTSGEGRIDLALAERATEPYIGKIGALGVFNIALPQRRIGLALKVLTGDDAAVAVAAPALMELVAPGALRPAEDWPWADVHNVVGAKVGRRLVTSRPRVYLPSHPHLSPLGGP